MRQVLPVVMEKGRVLRGAYGSPLCSGSNGAFLVKLRGQLLKIIASDGTDEVEQGWEHVSVSVEHRPPRWQEMSWVKDQFWDDEEVVFQLHPKRSEYVNCHPYCLHLWRHKVIPCPCPPSILVGPIEGGNQ